MPDPRRPGGFQISTGADPQAIDAKFDTDGDATPIVDLVQPAQVFLNEDELAAERLHGRRRRAVHDDVHPGADGRRRRDRPTRARRTTRCSRRRSRRRSCRTSRVCAEESPEHAVGYGPPAGLDLRRSRTGRGRPGRTEPPPWPPSELTAPRPRHRRRRSSSRLGSWWVIAGFAALLLAGPGLAVPGRPEPARPPRATPPGTRGAPR